MRQLLIIAISFATSFTSYTQSLEYQNLALLFSKNDRSGSARYTAMSGAFGAIGGDISAVNINPAGLAVYKNSAISGTFNSRNTTIASKYYGENSTTQNQFFNLSHIGAVLVFNSAYNSQWSKFALGFNYRITKDFNNSFFSQGNSGIATFTEFPLENNTPLINYNIADKQIFDNRYAGEINELNIAFSAVHQSKLYVGGGLNIYNLNFNQQATLTEFNSDVDGNELDAYFYQENISEGTGFSLSAGFIYKIHPNFRFGLAYQTPTWFTEIIETTNILDNDGYFGDTEIAVSNSEDIYSNNVDDFGNDYYPVQELIYTLKTPSRLTASAALIFGKKGLVSFDYSNKNYPSIKLSNDNFSPENTFFQNDLRNTHAFNIGTEWRLDRFSIRGGYMLEQSPYKKATNTENITGYSLGGGYNFGAMKIDVSYSDNNKIDSYNFYLGFDNVQPANLQLDNKIITTTVTFNL